MLVVVPAVGPPPLHRGLTRIMQVMLNPFHVSTKRITSPEFDRKVKGLAKRILG